MKKNITLAIIAILTGCITPVICGIKSIQFNQQCSGFLKQAADANTAEIALERINKALDYIEEHKLTSGYTSVFWTTEDENVGFWYDNIKACQKELEGCLESSQLEKSNVLMKVRESLTDVDDTGTSLTVPDGISRYPDNFSYGILRTISVLLLVLGFIIIYYSNVHIE